ncbi:MAG TPA: hypothetical protein PL004_09590 [Bacillota bacterium]|nr:hypothetical protein [Bacillota bacterium]
MAKGKPSENLLDSKVRCAVQAANALSKGKATDDEIFASLKNEFDDREISELIAYIYFISASQKFGAFLEIEPICLLNEEKGCT